MEHIEFSVGDVEIVGGGSDDFAISYKFEFYIDGGPNLSGPGSGLFFVKPPEIYFNHEMTPQTLEYTPTLAQGDIEVAPWDDRSWQYISGAGINIPSVPEEGVTLEDITLSGPLVATSNRNALVGFVQSWIDDFDNALPVDVGISIEYSTDQWCGGLFGGAKPASFILPSVVHYDLQPLPIELEESFSFTYLGVTEP